MGCVVVSADVGGVREVFDGMSIEKEVREASFAVHDIGDTVPGEHALRRSTLPLSSRRFCREEWFTPKSGSSRLGWREG